jgi:hypothetical protein
MADTIDARVAEVLAKLARVRKGLPILYRSFGWETHWYVLNPPLSEETVALFERQHGVRLPEDYRRFLITAGNGGAGPFYGVLPLERWNAAMAEELPGMLSRDYPLTLLLDTPRSATT